MISSISSLEKERFIDSILCDLKKLEFQILSIERDALEVAEKKHDYDSIDLVEELKDRWMYLEEQVVGAEAITAREWKNTKIRLKKEKANVMTALERARKKIAPLVQSFQS